NVNIPRKASAGRKIGKAIFQYKRNVLQPSSLPASSKSSWIDPCAYCLIQKIPNAFASPGKINALNVPTHPIYDIMTNDGMNDNCDGIIIVTSRRTNKPFLPGNSNFANVNPANEQKNRTTIAETVETNTVFIKEVQKSTLPSTLLILLKSSEPNINFGGNRNISLVLFVDITVSQ